MSQPYNEDLFEQTKMTFGEHLEELRSSLFKALLALIAGFCIGLFVGGSVVRWIQVPVVNALEEYHIKKAIVEMKKRLAEEGKPIPEDDELRATVAQADQGLIAEQAYIDAPQVLQALKQHYQEAFTGVEIPSKKVESSVPAPGELIPVSIWKPSGTRRARMTALSAQEAFMIYIKAALMFGAVISSPFVFYFVWSFVAAGLYPHEKKYIHVFMPMSIGLFLAGAWLAFTLVFKYVLDFLFSFNLWMDIEPELRISEWLSFVLLLPLGFGVSFQLPLVMLFLERIGIFSVAVYLEKWRIAVLAIAVISMILTPADPMSMMLMAAPLTILYFGGIGLCYLWPKKTSPFAEAA